MSEFTVEDMMKAYSEDAIELAKKFGKNLDFTEESIKQLEEILNIFHNELPKGFLSKLFRRGPSEELKVQMAKVWGGYFGEVIRRHVGGEWSSEDFQGQGSTIILSINDTQIFPVAKAYKRLTNGPEDNVWHYYQIMKHDLKN